MAAIQNDRDIILQATSPRVIPVKIPIDQVEGLPDRLDEIEGDVSALGAEVNNIMGNTQDLSIRVSSLTVNNSTSTTLTVVRKNGISGTVSWSVFAGVATLSGTGDSRTIAGNSISGSSVTVRAAIGSKEVFATINKVGALASQNTVNLSSQVTGQLSSGNVSGLGALALLNTVNLSTQTTGALNGQTQVTNLGTLAYANAIAADQIGAGKLAAGVIYSGTINANKINGGSFSGKEFTGGMFTGSRFRTSSSGERAELGQHVDGYGFSNLTFYDPSGYVNTIVSTRGTFFAPPVTLPGGAASSVEVRYNNLCNGVKIIQPIASSKCPLHFYNTNSTFPSPLKGGLFMHSTHGLCISDGKRWLKTTWKAV